MLLLRFIRLLLGKAVIKANFRILAQLTSASKVLRVLGATIGENTHIYSDICIFNMKDWSCSNLQIGSNAYIGPRCMFDLTSKITIEDDAAISAQVTFVTHLDVGNQPLKQNAPRIEGVIAVRRGAWIGVNSTILQNVEIGEFAMIGAMSLVNKNIPAEVVAFGVPCRVIRHICEKNEKQSDAINSNCNPTDVSGNGRERTIQATACGKPNEECRMLKQ